jgi:4-amino-4-deoxy-L-arabinose transferase-like glycosyltransferase
MTQERDRPGAAEWAALAAILAGALALRLWNVWELAAHDPFFTRPSVDEQMYHEWAQRIAAGDWRGDRVFLNGPLYPYLLGGFYALFGPSLFAARVAHAIVGTAVCALTWWVGRRRFPPAVALGAAALVAVSRMLVFYDSVLVVDPLIVLLALLAAAAAIAADESPGAGGWLAAGAVTGIGALARPNLVLVGALGVLASVWLRRDRPLRARAGWLAAFALGALACVAPVTWRNYTVSGDFVPVTYSGGMNLFIGNNPDANGSFSVPRIFPRSAADDPWEQREMFQRAAEQAVGRALRPSEVSRFWSSEALRFAREYPGPWARLLWHKLELATNAYEPWNIRSSALERDFSAVLRLPLLGFGVLAPLAVAGLVLTAARWRELVPLYAVLAMVLATLVAFFVLARYRIPAVPVLALFASAGVAEAVSRVRRRAWHAVAVAAAAAALAGGWAHREIAHDDLSIAYYNLGNRYRELADWPRAIACYERALATQPGYISAVNNLARVYEATGDHDAEARAAWQRVRALAAAQDLPRYAERAERHLHALAALGTEPQD